LQKILFIKAFRFIWGQKLILIQQSIVTSIFMISEKILCKNQNIASLKQITILVIDILKILLGR